MSQTLPSFLSGDPAAPLADILPPSTLGPLFRRPRDLRSAPVLAHLPFLFWLIEAAKPRLVVGLGVDEGVAHSALCQATELLGGGRRVVGLDLWSGGVPAELQARNDSQYADTGLLRSGDVLSPETAEAFEPGSIGLLSVALPLDDATLEALETLWLPRLTEEGLLILQGVTAQPLSATARARLRRWQTAWPCISFDHGEGLLAVLIGPAQPDRLLALAELRMGMEGHDEAQQIFRRLGQMLESEARAIPGPDVPLPPDLLAGMTRALAEAQEAALQQRETATRLRSDLERRDAGAPEQLAQIEAALTRARSEILGLRDRERQLTDALATAGQQAAERERAYAEIVSSTSWRITGPLRRVVLMTRRRRAPDDAAR